MNYQRIHDQIIDRSRSENRKKLKRDHIDYIYYESHHILPRCLGGSDKKENLVLLTAREHFLVHWLLVRINSKNHKLVNAFWMMCSIKDKGNRKYIPSSRIYQEARKLNAKLSSEKVVPIEIGRRISELYANRTLEQRVEVSRKQKETIASKPEEEKRAIVKKTNETKSNKSPEAKTAIYSKVQETKIKNKTTGEGKVYLEETKKKISEGVKKVNLQKTPEQKAESTRKRNKTNSSKSSEQKQVENDKRSKKPKEMSTNL